jgi:hypothetical protein
VSDQANCLSRAFVLPRIGPDRESFASIKERRRRQRLEDINDILKAQNYYEWRAAQKEEDSRDSIAIDPLWYDHLYTFSQSAPANVTTARFVSTTSLQMRRFAVFIVCMPSTPIA